MSTKVSSTINTISEFVVLIGVCMFLMTIYMIGTDYWSVHTSMQNITLYSSTELPAVFDQFESIVILAVTKLLPMSLVLMSAGCLIAKHLMTKSSRIFILSLSGVVVILSAYFSGGRFDVVCAESLGSCLATIFPIGLLIFTSILLASKSSQDTKSE